MSLGLLFITFSSTTSLSLQVAFSKEGIISGIIMNVYGNAGRSTNDNALYILENHIDNGMYKGNTWVFLFLHLLDPEAFYSKPLVPSIHPSTLYQGGGVL